MTIKTDDQVGHWRVLRLQHRRALCRCRCGTTSEVSLDALQDGTSTSCGCSTFNKTTQLFRLPDWRPERGR